MDEKAQRRLVVLHEIAQGQLSTVEAAALLGVTARHARRLVAAYQRAGASALRHGNTGRQPAHTIAPEVRARVVALAQTTYQGGNHQHLAELQAEREGLAVSRSSVRRIVRAAGLASPREHAAPQHRQRRPRYPQAGMLVQVDASLPGPAGRWMAGRGPSLTLVAAIDAATNEVPAAVFRAAEDAHGYVLLVQRLVAARGCPVALYHDRHGIFPPPPKQAWTVAEPLAGRQAPTQFGRLLAELGRTSVAAPSPQAKGRGERLFGTRQDRLVVELRGTRAEANTALDAFLARFNERFRVPAAQAGSAYRPLAASPPPETRCCCKYQRVVAADNTVQFAGQRLQLLPGAARQSWARATVEVHERLDGSLAAYSQGACLATAAAPLEAPALRARGKRLATAAPPPPQEPPPRPPATPPLPTPRKPAPSHPWRTPRPQRPARTESPDSPDDPGHFH